MNNYNPQKQYRCTIIRGKSQTEMEDLLPIYANIVHKYCPCKEDIFKRSCCQDLSKILFKTKAYDQLPDSNKKTVHNHLTEIAGTLLGLYFPVRETDGTYIYETESCKYLVENDDIPVFFKNLCLNFQFPNGAKKANHISEDIRNNIKFKPFCYVIALLYYAQSQKQKVLLTKQEIGYYVLNSLDVLQGNVNYETVYNQIINDREKGIKRPRLSGSKEWQHIKEQFNLLELSNIVETDATYIWLNDNEKASNLLFINHLNKIDFDAYRYDLNVKANRELFLHDWKVYYGKFNHELINAKTKFTSQLVVVDHKEQIPQKGATMSNTDLGDEGEALVFRLEQERIRNYKARLVNKVLLLGKTKGLGYDISSIEADENPQKPEFARYIEVKSTKRITEPSFDKTWSDTLHITAKEWIAAEQYGDYYNIYRVYFTKNKTFVVRIQNPYKKSQNGDIEVYPTIYQMNFDAKVIEIRYAK